MEAARLRALTGQLHKIHRIHTLSNDKKYMWMCQNLVLAHPHMHLQIFSKIFLGDTLV